MSNNSNSRQKMASRNSAKNLTWVNPSFGRGCFSSRDDRFDGRRTLSFFIGNAQVVDKEQFVHDGKTIPSQKCFRLSCRTFLDEDTLESFKFNMELPLNDRYRVCNGFLNKLAFVISETESGNMEWDGGVTMSIYHPKESPENTRLFVDFFDLYEFAERYNDKQCSLFEYDADTRTFEGVPAFVPVLNKKGEQLKKDDRLIWDTSEFDQFYLDLATDICDRLKDIL